MISIQKLTPKTICESLPKRKSNSHKGDYGHTLIIAGSKGMGGASTLCALGALRGGSGLVTVAIPKSLQPIAARWIRPEAMTFPLPETEKGAIAKNASRVLLNFILKKKIRSLAIGPGLSRETQTRECIKTLLSALNRTETKIEGIVLDADGLIALKEKIGETSLLEKLKLPIIVTPHAGEMANFCNTIPSEIEKDRVSFAKKFARLYQVVAVLKGHKTVITDGDKIYLNSTGNPGMATGGSGDVLTGLIAALIPQMNRCETLLRAAAIGVFVHGLAGDLAREEKTEISLIAGDIAEKIPSAFKKIYGR